jgi:hypothetical protein
MIFQPVVNLLACEIAAERGCASRWANRVNWDCKINGSVGSGDSYGGDHGVGFVQFKNFRYFLRGQCLIT